VFEIGVEDIINEEEDELAKINKLIDVLDKISP
jgi:hypothetical protein